METCVYQVLKDVLYNCTKPVSKGLRNIGYIYNYDDIDWDKVTYDETTPNIITALPMKEGKKGYKIAIPGKTPFTGTTTSMTEGTYRNNFTKSVAVVILDAGPDVSHSIIDPMANGKFLVVLENQYQGTDKKNTFQVFGVEQGLSASAIESDKYADDAQGGTSVTLQETDAPTFAYYLFETDIAATREMLESTLTVSPGE